MQKISPFLWFNDNAEDAANFYTSIFKDSRITSISRYDDASSAASGRPAGSVMVVNFTLQGQEFIALNGGPTFTFSPAISFVVNCETQEEVDMLWDKLSTGGATNQCGWLTDKFGVSWQIVPTVLGQLIQHEDPAVSNRVTRAMLQMTKLDIASLRAAAEGG